MPYCRSCGKQVEENIAFCPNCGAALGAIQTPVAPRPPTSSRRYEKGEKREKEEKGEKREKEERREKSEFSLMWIAVIGVVLVLLGLASFLTDMGLIRRQISWAWVLLAIGAVIVVTSIYMVTAARRRYPRV